VVECLTSKCGALSSDIGIVPQNFLIKKIKIHKMKGREEAQERVMGVNTVKVHYIPCMKMS
jgi:hypothetical protein